MRKINVTLHIVGFPSLGRFIFEINYSETKGKGVEIYKFCPFDYYRLISVEAGLDCLKVLYF